MNLKTKQPWFKIFRLKRKGLFVILVAGALAMGIGVSVHQSNSSVDLKLFRKLPIPMFRVKPGSALHPFNRPSPYFEQLSISGDGEKIALLLVPFRWGTRFCILDIQSGELGTSLDIDDCSPETLLTPSFHPGILQASHILWAPDNSEVVFSVRRVDYEGDNSSKTKKWLTYVYNLQNGKYIKLNGYTVLNVINPFAVSNGELLLKRELDKMKDDKEERFSLSLIKLPSSTQVDIVPHKFNIRKGDFVLMERNKVFVFEQGQKRKARVWAVDLISKEEQLVSDLEFKDDFLYYSRPLPGSDYFLTIGMNEKFPLEPSGQKVFVEVREFPSGKLFRRISFPEEELSFLSWSAKYKYIALLKYGSSSAGILMWNVEEDRFFEAPLKKELLVSSADFLPSSCTLYLLGRENVQECDLYRLVVPIDNKL